MVQYFVFILFFAFENMGPAAGLPAARPPAAFLLVPGRRTPALAAWTGKAAPQRRARA